MAGKLVFLITHGLDNPEKATIAFTMATATQAMGNEVVIGLLADGAELVRKGTAEKINYPGCTPLKVLLEAFVSRGGRLITCPPGLAARHIAQADFIEGVSVVHASDFAQEYVSALNVLTF
jgi:predicted peroxiredoxin